MRGMDQWIFPHQITTELSQARDEPWRGLTDYIADLDETHEDSLAFTLMMIEACGCATCQPGGYRLTLGCATCSFRAISNLKESDEQLLSRFHRARQEVCRFLATQGEPVAPRRGDPSIPYLTPSAIPVQESAA